MPKTHAQINIKFEKFNALYENFEIIDQKKVNTRLLQETSKKLKGITERYQRFEFKPQNLKSTPKEEDEDIESLSKLQILEEKRLLKNYQHTAWVFDEEIIRPKLKLESIIKSDAPIEVDQMRSNSKLNKTSQ